MTGLMKALFVAIVALASLPACAWVPADSIDDMTGKKELSVYASSENNVTLSWPYGNIGAKLYIRNHPRYGKDVIFQADKGQISCRSYAPCRVLVRFDERTPVTFAGANPSDGSTEVVFIRGFEKFTKELEKSKTLKIQVEFYHNGNQTFIFNVDGFSLSRLSAPKAATTTKK